MVLEALSGGSEIEKPAYLGKNYDSIKESLDRIAPKEEDFSDVYPKEQIDNDLKVIEKIKNKGGYLDIRDDSDAKVLENTAVFGVNSGDWFYERDMGIGDDPKAEKIMTFPTAELDDLMNHIDFVAIIKNKKTNYETMPFSVDVTFNMSDSGIYQKLRWKHHYGIKEEHDDGTITSEFGNLIDETDEDYVPGRDTVKMLPFGWRYGLNLPGFASAKFFEDKVTDGETLEKGRIPIMPRLVVGYSPEIARVIAEGEPKPLGYEDLAGLDEKQREEKLEEVDEKRVQYLIALSKAKWCTLVECYAQAHDIQYMLDKLDDDILALEDKDELATAKKQIQCLCDYFDGAVGAANERLENELQTKMKLKLESIGLKHALNDKRVEKILNESRSCYRESDWRAYDDPYWGKDTTEEDLSLPEPMPAKDIDLSGLDDWTLLDVSTTTGAAEQDRALMDAEIARREERGEFNPVESKISTEKDFDRNYLKLFHGRILYPTEEYRDFLQNENETSETKKIVVQRRPVLGENEKIESRSREVLRKFGDAAITVVDNTSNWKL